MYAKRDQSTSFSYEKLKTEPLSPDEFELCGSCEMVKYANRNELNTRITRRNLGERIIIFVIVTWKSLSRLKGGFNYSGSPLHIGTFATIDYGLARVGNPCEKSCERKENFRMSALNVPDVAMPAYERSWRSSELWWLSAHYA